MPFKKLIDSLKIFWEENVATNYKKISIALGTMIVTVSYYIFLDGGLIDIFPAQEGIWQAIYVFIVILTISFFGSKEDNELSMPSKIEIQQVIEEFPEVAKFIIDKTPTVKHIEKVLQENIDVRCKFNDFVKLINKEQKQIKKEEFT